MLVSFVLGPIDWPRPLAPGPLGPSGKCGVQSPDTNYVRVQGSLNEASLGVGRFPFSNLCRDDRIRSGRFGFDST
jgi:hypothetical protein